MEAQIKIASLNKEQYSTGSAGTAVFQKLVVKKERSLFWGLAIISALVWVAVAVSIVGLVFLATGAFFVWFATGLMAAYLKSEAVELTQDQMPELYESFVTACKKLEISRVPRLYVMQSGGALNAFAMRHSRRNFVVLYSDLVEAFAPDSKEVQFIIGHELGHIRQNHLAKNAFLAPVWLLPVFWAAYSRARESTCDRFGAYVANDMDASLRAMLALSGGKKLCHLFSAQQFAHQHVKNRGFFVSLHELTSGYPTLSRRVADLLAYRQGWVGTSAPRHALAYLFACFSFGTGIFRYLIPMYAATALVFMFVITPALKGTKKLYQGQAALYPSEMFEEENVPEAEAL